MALARYCVGSQAFQRIGYDLDAYVQRKFAVCVGTGLRRPVTKKQACQPAAAEEEVAPAAEPPTEEEKEEGAGDPHDI